MKNELLDKGIILPSGEIGKDKINLVAGAITQPFAEMVWVTTGGDMETINRLTDILVTMNTPADRGKLFKIIKMLYGLMGLPFSGEAQPMDADPAVLEYFIFSFTADFLSAFGGLHIPIVFGVSPELSADIIGNRCKRGLS